MKYFKCIAILPLALLLLMSKCNSPNGISVQNKIDHSIDSLKSIYAPDKRIALWTISTSVSSDTLYLTGEVDNKQAYQELLKLSADKNTIVINQIKLLPEENFDQKITGLINNSVANLRSNSRHSGEIGTQALLGTPIKIFKREGDWYLVQTPNKYIAWVDAPAVVVLNSTELNNYKQAKKIIYNKQYGFSYSTPDVNSQIVSDLVIGCILQVTDSVTGFYKVSYPDDRIAWVKKEETEDLMRLIDSYPNKASLTNTAKKFVGIPYLWGGTSSKGIDCSGFTSTIYLMNGVVLQRDASQQTKYGQEITTDYNYEKLEVGDLLFFGRKATDSLSEKVTHVAMYIGDTEFIHASGRVRINSMDSTRENFIPEYVPRFVRAVRVKNNYDGFGIEKISENDFYREILN